MTRKIREPVYLALSPIEKELIASANEARALAYAPYSKFAVGAAVRMKSGAIFLGCNVENTSYGLTICAERVALYAAIASGERTFSHIALVADQTDLLSPCGACRQVLAELAPRAQVLMANVSGILRRSDVEELLPFPFKHS